MMDDASLFSSPPPFLSLPPFLSHVVQLALVHLQLGRFDDLAGRHDAKLDALAAETKREGGAVERRGGLG